MLIDRLGRKLVILPPGGSPQSLVAEPYIEL